MSELPETPAPVVADAWRELWSLVTAMRPDFDAIAWQGAIVACRDSGVPFADAAPVVWRQAWNASVTSEWGTKEVRDLARARKPPPTGAGVYARGAQLARELFETRGTGPMQRLTQDNDRRNA